MKFLKNLFSKISTNKNQNWIIQSIERETEEAITLKFTKPKDFIYKAGQFLIFEKEINGKKVKREYSFSSSPNEELISITAKKIEGGLFSKYLNESIQPNDVLKVTGPKGNFIVEPLNNKKYVAFAGGSGITPIFSIIKLLMLEEKSSLHLFYGNQSENTIIFKNKLNQLVEKYPNRLKVTHVLEKSNGMALEGIIDEPKLDLFFEKYFDSKEIDEYLICGPGKMIENITNYLKNKNIASNKIKFELFTAANNPILSKEKINGVSSTIQFRYDDVEKTIEYTDISKTIIDALVDIDENVPYSCKNGVCGSCMAKVVEGEVTYAPPALNILDDEKVKKGYVLTCCSYPKTPQIALDFNVE